MTVTCGPLRNEIRSRLAQRLRDVVGVAGPLGVGPVIRALVCRLGRLDQVNRDGDVFLQGPGQLVTGAIAIEGCNGAADVLLVLQERCRSDRAARLLVCV